MEGSGRRRRREWRAAGRKKADRTFRRIAIVLTFLVIAVTLFFGYLRKHEVPASPAINLSASGGAGDDG